MHLFVSWLGCETWFSAHQFIYENFKTLEGLVVLLPEKGKDEGGMSLKVDDAMV